MSDRGSDFLSSLIKEVCSLTGMRKINTSAYHPQTDGMVERMNRTLIQMISKHSKFYGGEWDQYLNYLLFAYRVRPHSSSGSSPFYAHVRKRSETTNADGVSGAVAGYAVGCRGLRKRVEERLG